MTDAFDRLQAALAGRYALAREIGAGGMATVYLAEDLSLFFTLVDRQADIWVAEVSSKQ